MAVKWPWARANRTKLVLKAAQAMAVAGASLSANRTKLVLKVVAAEGGGVTAEGRQSNQAGIESRCNWHPPARCARAPIEPSWY